MVKINESFTISYEKFLVKKLSQCLSTLDYIEAVKYRRALVAHYNGNEIKIKVKSAFPFDNVDS